MDQVVCHEETDTHIIESMFSWNFQVFDQEASDLSWKTIERTIELLSATEFCWCEITEYDINNDYINKRKLENIHKKLSLILEKIDSSWRYFPWLLIKVSENQVIIHTKFEEDDLIDAVYKTSSNIKISEDENWNDKISDKRCTFSISWSNIIVNLMKWDSAEYCERLERWLRFLVEKSILDEEISYLLD